MIKDCLWFVSFLTIKKIIKYPKDLSKKSEILFSSIITKTDFFDTFKVLFPLL